MIAIAPTRIHFCIHFHSILNYDFYNHDIKYHNFYHYYIIIALNLLLYIIQCHNNENVDIYCHMKTYLNVVYVAMHHVNLFLINFFPYYK